MQAGREDQQFFFREGVNAHQSIQNIANGPKNEEWDKFPCFRGRKRKSGFPFNKP